MYYSTIYFRMIILLMMIQSILLRTNRNQQTIEKLDILWDTKRGEDLLVIRILVSLLIKVNLYHNELYILYK